MAEEDTVNESERDESRQDGSGRRSRSSSRSSGTVVDERGNEYSTFNEEVAARLPGLEGKRARIQFHE